MASLEALTTIKSKELLDLFIAKFPDRSVEDYRLSVMLNYSLNILDSIIIAIYTFFSLNKPLNRFYKLIFAGLILIRIINSFLKFQIYSFFYYLLLILYIVLFIHILKIPNGGEK